jgi:hypothetical protein
MRILRIAPMVNPTKTLQRHHQQHLILEKREACRERLVRVMTRWHSNAACSDQDAGWPRTVQEDLIRYPFARDCSLLPTKTLFSTGNIGFQFIEGISWSSVCIFEDPLYRMAHCFWSAVSQYTLC